MSDTNCPPLFGGQPHHFTPTTIKDPFHKGKKITVWICKYCSYVQEAG